MDESYGDDVVSQNAPDYPTNTETAQDNFEYSGGLNKPKSTGQTTVPVIASQGDRQNSYADIEEDALQRMMEMSGIREAKAKPDFLDMDDDGDKQEPMKKAVDDKEGALKEEEDEFNESIQRMREIAGIQETKKQVDQNSDGKNDFEDIKIARMKASGAIDDKEEKKVDESIFALTNQWRAYKG